MNLLAKESDKYQDLSSDKLANQGSQSFVEQLVYDSYILRFSQENCSGPRIHCHPICWQSKNCKVRCRCGLPLLSTTMCYPSRGHNIRFSYPHRMPNIIPFLRLLPWLQLSFRLITRVLMGALDAVWQWQQRQFRLKGMKQIQVAYCITSESKQRRLAMSTTTQQLKTSHCT